MYKELIIDTAAIPDGIDASTIISTVNSTNMLPIFNDIALDKELPDTIFEHLGDILALEIIKPAQYFRLKAMLHSSDLEVTKMAREIILKNLQNV